MKSNYRRVGDFIEQVNVRNTDGKISKLLGVNLDKEFMPSVANINGTDMTKYKVIKKGQFGCKLMSVGRDKKVPISLLIDEKEALISSAYFVFEVIDENLLLPEYLMMWFRRSESDRYQWFQSGGDIRGRITWEEFCDLPIKVPSIEKQREIVADYNTVQDRIRINEQLNTALEETAQALYRHWFVDFEFPVEYANTTVSSSESRERLDIENIDHTKGRRPELVEGYKSSGGAMEYNEELDMEIPMGWEVESIAEIADLRYGKMLDSALFLDEGYPVYSGYGIRGYYSEYHYEEPMILVLCRGVSGTGEVRMSPANAFITNLSIVVIENQDLISKNYLYYYLKNNNLRRLDSGSAQSQITINDLENDPVLIPDNKIALDFAERIETLNNQRTFLLEENKTLKKVKITLLSKMATVVDDKTIMQPVV